MNDFYVSRLDFLRYSLATSVAVWAGSQVSGISEAEARELFGPTAVNENLFPQSVASGDPKSNGIVLWTRIRPPEGGGTARIGYRVALDDGRTDNAAFADPVLSGVVETSRTRDYTAKVQLQNASLKPFRKYRYRFYYAGGFSRTGRFKTLPAPGKVFGDDEALRFGYISCQDYTNGYYNALGALAKEDIDFVVHLGDYIYETVEEESFQGSQVRPIDPARLGSGTPGEADTLQDYRFLYKLYKADKNLQAVHENFAFIMVWDDHEFANDSFQVFAPDAAGEFRDPQRRSDATRAWVEFNPVGVYYNPARDPLEEVVIYRYFDFGDLMTLVMTDERLYRDGPPCGLDTLDRVATPGCSMPQDENDPDKRGEEDTDRTMLGLSQREFFLQKITRSPQAWKFWGNEVTFMQNKVLNTFLGGADSVLPGVPPAPAPANGVYLNLDQWDGYQAERERITRTIKNEGVENFVIITGDIHTFIAGYVRQNYDNPIPPDGLPVDRVGTCFVGGSVTSSNLFEIARLGQVSDGPRPSDPGAFSAAVKASNPHFVFLDSSTHGYNLMKVTKNELICTMRQVDTVRQPQNNPTADTLAQFRVPEGEVQIIRTDLLGPLLSPT